MPARTLDVPVQVLPATPPPKFHGKVSEKRSIRCSLPETTSCKPGPPLIETKSLAEAEAEGEAHTLSSYGDLSFSDGFIISSYDDSPGPVVEPIQPKPSSTRPRFRLKVRRPPMPKRRLSYVHVGAPFLINLDRQLEDVDRPGSPDPLRNSQHHHHHQPLLSPHFIPSSSPSGRTGAEVNSNASSTAQCSLAHTPIPAVTRDLPLLAPSKHEPSSHKKSSDEQLVCPSSDGSGSTPPLPSQKPKPEKEKPRSGGGGWRTRLPPRLPLPKWDI
ncbi:hypothetical protein ID866_963 [Astraeus odoratus]|nr:hypothetical protein ID866_963 [Astraeus odoratus]